MGNSTPMRIGRRRFLQLAGLAAAGGAAMSQTVNSWAAPADGRSRGESVVVLGAGLAGLCAAYELRARGYRVLAILEAQRRTGGRVLTVRKGFRNGQFAELGATRIASSHDFTLAYIDQFGLPLTEFSDGNGLYYLKGKAPFVHEDGTPWPGDVLPDLANDPEDATLGADSIVWKYDRGNHITDPESLEFLGDPRSAAWPLDNEYATSLLPVSYRDYWRHFGASDDAFLLNRAINGSEIYTDGALYWLAADVLDATWSRTYAIAGGNDQLPQAFTTALAGLVRYACRVTGIHQGSSSVTVDFVHGRSPVASRIEADRVVCALPFTMLREMDIDPLFADDKMTAIQAMRYMPVSRYYMHTRSRFWTARGIGGLKIARTDTDIDRIWHNTDVQDGETGIIQAYMQNQTGIDYAASGPTFAARSAHARETVREFFPEIDGELIGGMEKIWQNDPYVKGAWGWFAAGEQDMLPVAKRPEQRIHFCGEHTSGWSGWMQGAFESAHRVVDEITGG